MVLCSGDLAHGIVEGQAEHLDVVREDRAGVCVRFPPPYVGGYVLKQAAKTPEMLAGSLASRQNVVECEGIYPG